MNLIDELIQDELDEFHETLAHWIATRRIEAVCPHCSKSLPNHYPGRTSLCGNRGVSPEEVIYRAVVQS